MDEREQNGGNGSCPKCADFPPKSLEEKAAEDNFLKDWSEDDRREQPVEQVIGIRGGRIEEIGGIDLGLWGEKGETVFCHRDDAEAGDEQGNMNGFPQTEGFPRVARPFEEKEDEAEGDEATPEEFVDRVGEPPAEDCFLRKVDPLYDKEPRNDEEL